MTTDPVTQVVWMIRGAWVTLCMRAAANLGLFDHLDRPLPAARVAELTGADPHALTRLLRALADVGLVEPDGDAWAITPLGEVLRADHPSNVRALLQMQTWLPHLSAWVDLEDAVRHGRGVFEAVNGAPPWQLFSANPEVEAQFNAAMARRAADQVEAVVAAVGPSGVRTVVDVGGGRGALLAELLARWPDVSGVVADRPAVVAEAEAAFAEAGLSERARGLAADFFVSVPADGDLYLISNVLHDWEDDDCVAILRTVRAAMRPGARLLVVEKVLGVAGRSPVAERDLHFVDLHMLVLFGARERTFEEYDLLLRSAGFAPARLTGAGLEWNVMEAAG